MSDDQAHELRERGIEAAKAGQKDEARRLLQRALRIAPQDETGWLWLASVAQDRRERLLCLQKVLEIDPEHEMALKAVRAMGVDPKRLIPEKITIDRSLAAEDQTVSGPGIPMPDAAAIEAMQESAQQIIDGYLAEQESGPEINWTRKTKRRAGEREVVMLRLQVAVAVLVFGAAVIGLAVLGISNSPEVQLALFGASPTPRPPTSTPTNTPTNTPGLTPTPSPTVDFTNEPTFTPSPTINPFIVAGRIEQTPRPTSLYLQNEVNNAISTAAAMIREGNPGDAVPIMSTQRAQTGLVFNPYPYYLQAIGLLGDGQPQAALASLNEAQRRLDTQDGVSETDARRYRPLINAGLSQVYLAQAAEAYAAGRRDTGNELTEQIITLGEQMISIDTTYAPGYVLVAQAYQLRGDYESAIEVLDDGQSDPAMLSDMNLIVARGRIYLEQGQRARAARNEDDARAFFAEAGYQGYFATYVNPWDEAGHQIRIEAALEMDEPGLAVIHSETYRLFHPDSATAARLQGDARVGEGKNDLALEVYSEALALSGTDAEIADILISRGALYTLQRRYDQALADLNEAVALRDDLATRALRMRAAYNAGDLETASEDAEMLVDTGVINPAEVRLMQARILIDQGDPDDSSTMTRALGMLVTLENLPDILDPAADEYRARAHLALGNLGDALNSINRALGAAETGSRRYLRGLIHEAREETDDALIEYEWVLTWNEIYRYPFASDARARIDGILEARARAAAEATATAITATAAVRQATGTAVGEITATARAAATATATAAVPITETAQAFASATATAAVPITETAAAEAEATASTEAEMTATAEAVVTETAQVEQATGTIQAATARVEQATQRALDATATKAVQPTAAPGSSLGSGG